MAAVRRDWTDFFRDSRDIFSAFTVISLLAGFTLVTAPLVCRLMAWPLLTREETGALVLVYCISALSDALLGIYLNKLPSTLNIANGGDQASITQGGADSSTLNDTPARD